jgi:ubiquinol-cytochrome c reductase cytochrome b/c1 subunit
MILKTSSVLKATLLAGLVFGAWPAAAQDAAKAGAPEASAQETNETPPRQSWSFAGPFGKFDTAQLQRGYQVYREVCSTCHSMHFMSFRNLSQPGGPSFSESQVKALAATFKVQDGPNDSGDMFDRPGRASDPFPSPFPNEQAARAANGGALPPDMSVLAKAREIEGPWYAFLTQPFSEYQEQGVDYIHGILNGYKDAPKDFPLPTGKYYNIYFPGHAISMPKPLSDGQVDYTDGSPKTVEQYSHDVAAFLAWVAEPKLDQRKSTGLTVIVFLIVFAAMLYAIKRRIWAGLHDTSGTTPVTDH